MITKAVIPVAGYGTRMLPAVKTIPKEMLPIIDKPAIHYIVENAAKSGIKDIIFITSGTKKALEDYFDYNFELEEKLKQADKKDQAKQIHDIADLASFAYIRQKQMKGNGHAVLCAKSFVGKEPFVVNFGDEHFDTEVPSIKQMIEAYEKYQALILCSVIVPKSDVSKYGIITGEKVADRIWKATGMVEKPDPKETDSQLASTASYVLPPGFCEVIEKTPVGKGGEIWLADAIGIYMKSNPVYALEFKQEDRFDTGNPDGYLKTIVHYAQKRQDTRGMIQKYLDAENHSEKVNL